MQSIKSGRINVYSRAIIVIITIKRGTNFILRQLLQLEDALERREDRDLKHHRVHFRVERDSVEKFYDTIIGQIRIELEVSEAAAAGTDDSRVRQPFHEVFEL